MNYWDEKLLVEERKIDNLLTSITSETAGKIVDSIGYIGRETVLTEGQGHTRLNLVSFSFWLDNNRIFFVFLFQRQKRPVYKEYIVKIETLLDGYKSKIIDPSEHGLLSRNELIKHKFRQYLLLRYASIHGKLLTNIENKNPKLVVDDYLASFQKKTDY